MPTLSLLGSAQIRSIAAIQTRRVIARLAERNIQLRFTDAALDALAAAGFDPVYGARPLKRSIQSLVENPLAQKILSGEFAQGDKLIADAKDGALSFKRA